MTLAGGALIAVGAAASLTAAGAVRSTPAGTSAPALASGLGIALLFPAIFLTASGGQSYWDGPRGHSAGIVLLLLAIAAALAWAGTVAGVSTRGADAALTLMALGYVAVNPVGAAFNQFGDLGSGGWLALAGGVLAAGGTWASRDEEMQRAAAAAT